MVDSESDYCLCFFIHWSICLFVCLLVHSLDCFSLEIFVCRNHHLRGSKQKESGRDLFHSFTPNLLIAHCPPLCVHSNHRHHHRQREGDLDHHVIMLSWLWSLSSLWGWSWSSDHIMMIMVVIIILSAIILIYLIMFKMPSCDQNVELHHYLLHLHLHPHLGNKRSWPGEQLKTDKGWYFRGILSICPTLPSI